VEGVSLFSGTAAQIVAAGKLPENAGR
jgi:hypothetical protein